MNRRTTSFSLWDAQVDLLVFAATRHDMNVSEYFREHVIPFVARECGKEVPDVPKVSRHSSSFPPTATNGLDYDMLAEKVVAKMTALVQKKK